MTSEEPLKDNPIGALRSVPSLVLVNTGDGKGKSSAAVGVLVRAVARGWKVAVVQFLKSGDWATGEQKIAEQLGVDWWAMVTGSRGTLKISRRALLLLVRLGAKPRN